MATKSRATLSTNYQSEVKPKPKPIVTCSHAFSRAWRRLHVFASSSDWFIVCVCCHGPGLFLLFWFQLKTSLKFCAMSYPAFSKLLVTLPMAWSTISNMAAYVLRTLLLMKLYLSISCCSAWTGEWTFWKGKYRKRGLEELCSSITLTACCA